MVMLLAIFVVKGFYEREKKDEEKLSIEIVKIPMILYRENKKDWGKRRRYICKRRGKYSVSEKRGQRRWRAFEWIKNKKERVEGLYEVRLISKNSSDEEVKSTLGCLVRIGGEA